MFSFLFLLFMLWSLSLADSGRRFSMSLNGLWRFKADFRHELADDWFIEDFKSSDYIDMPVPSSFNDITMSREIKDHVGWVLYQRHILIPAFWINSKRVVLKIGGAHYFTKAWINTVAVGEHEGGHIPFEFDISHSLKTNEEQYILTIAINNTLNEHSIPQGFVVFENDTFKYPLGYRNYYHNFDYFDYAGLNGNVDIYVTNRFHYIEDIVIKTESTSQKGYVVNYSVKLSSKHEKTLKCLVSLVDKYNIVKSKEGFDNSIVVQNAKLWWPIGTANRTVGYLYTLRVQLFNKTGEILDMLETKFGFRHITWNTTTVSINDKHIYLRGFGMHQDAETRGRGFDYVQLTKDINLLKWVGANAIRTSHYPYFEEFFDYADRTGIMVIIETPACSLSTFDNVTLERHKSILKEMWLCFKNHPSIIMWSLANEPLSNLPESNLYFKTLIEYMRSLDQTRPITFVTSQQIMNEKAAQHVDIICLNRYSGWYQDQARLDLISYQISKELSLWHEKYKKPVLITEFGAGALSGVHELPSLMWSEEYQSDLFKEHYKAFDCLRAGGFFLGEMIWNFADFNTPQEYIRPAKCVKGIFTRSRHPKSAAFTVQSRFQDLSKNVINEDLGSCNYIPQH